ncbi:MAG: hypothetical protein KF914_06635 [Rhizobiaceae bacterium]|nr:hypothetical protein [Rhizobiaceae bacterium]
MFYEDLKIQRGDTLWALAEAYAYKGKDWEKIWKDPKNAALVAKRKKPELCVPGDEIFVPIPWDVTTTTLIAGTTGSGASMSKGAKMTVIRDGELGKRLSFVQTVFRGNQPIGPNPSPFCVDACTPDDDLPFYFTAPEIKSDPERRRRFFDFSQRPPPGSGKGDTNWRGIVSLAVVTEKRVTIWAHQLWGWDLKENGTLSLVGPRDPNIFELSIHLALLKTGVGTGPLDFGAAGWTFRFA